MAVNFNVNMYYEELVHNAASRAKEELDDGNYGDESECISQAIYDCKVYYADQAYIVARAVMQGLIEFNKDVNWDEIYEMLYNDIASELEYMKDKE